MHSPLNDRMLNTKQFGDGGFHIYNSPNFRGMHAAQNKNISLLYSILIQNVAQLIDIIRRFIGLCDGTMNPFLKSHHAEERHRAFGFSHRQTF